MALAVLVEEAKATTTATRTAPAALVVLVVRLAELMLALVALVDPVAQAATAFTEMAAATEPQAALAQRVQTATIPTALPVERLWRLVRRRSR